MQPRVSQAVKSVVVQDWLRGLTRDTIAANHGLSAGTVTNIIREWMLGLDEAIADELREFAVSLRRLRITAPTAAEGARVASMLTSLGVDKDDFYLFISETHRDCIKLGLQPERIAHDLKQLLDLSDSVPWEQIPIHIERQLGRKKQLEGEIQQLESLASEAKKRLDTALEEEAASKNEMNQFFIFTREMRKHRIPMEDLPMLVETINGIKMLGYDPKAILSKLSGFERLQTVEKELMDRVNEFTNKKTKLENECSSAQAWLDTHSLTLNKYFELEQMGFGLKELKTLWHKITEIGAANKLDPDQAVQKFLKDMELYDDKLGFEAQSDNSNVVIQMIQPMNQGPLIDIISDLIRALTAHLDDIKKIGEFRPLLKEAKGESVPLPELKSGVIKAIDLLIRAISPLDDTTVEILNSAKLALEKTLNDVS
jgi:hypothetical protein